MTKLFTLVTWFQYILVMIPRISLPVLSLQTDSARRASEFIGQLFIQDAIKNPKKPQSVLSFFFGIDYNNGKHKELMRDGVEVVQRMNSIWFGGTNTQYDTVCRESFADVIRDAGKENLNWNDSIDGLVAQLVLCDQISRNAFRGTNEAFSYDERATSIASTLMKSAVSRTQLLAGEFFPPYYIFMITALMHSEDKQLHEEAMSFIRFVKGNAPQLNDYWDYQLQFELDHVAVINRFGRYPHRNKYVGRSSTLEEEEYLKDTDNLPAWAKF
jgi:uncharacterized protein (DUF924 family)